MLRLRVVRDGGYSVGFAASAVRNLMRALDAQPFNTYLVGIVSVVVTKSGQRLGDLVGGTVVVREQLVNTPAAPKRRNATPSSAPQLLSTVLSDVEYRLLERWYDRLHEIETAHRAVLTDRIAERLAHALPTDDAPVTARLLRLFAAEQGARQRGMAARAESGAGRERYAIVATQSPRWIAFASKLASAQQHGLASLGERGVRDFVAEYRGLTSDLARLRTATRGVATDELFYLGRLVAAAHSLIYRDRRADLLDILRFFSMDIPREIRRSYAPILLAAVLMFGPAAIAYTAVVLHPETADTFIPKAMRQRAEDGIERARNGIGYIEDPQMFRPVMATEIVSNNVQVTFFAFAGGATAGIFTALLLLLNGMSLGGVMGLYVSKGIGTLILAFVAPHGVLELTAICIAGGGGFLIAAAILIPGDRTRRQAFAENSIRAIKLIGGSTVLLIAAGLLEGMVSPIPYWPVSLKLCVSGFTAVMLYLYIRSGAGSRPHGTSGTINPADAPEAALQQPLGLHLEIPIHHRGGHLGGAHIEHRDPGPAHAR